MSLLFVCSQCGCVDAVESAFRGAFPLESRKQRCTECQTGSWHGQFEKQPYDPDRDNVINRGTGISVL